MAEAALIDIMKWMTGDDAGLSSRAIAAHMSTGWSDGSYPHDPADLGRCLRLLERFPQWKPRIVEMAQYHPVWAAYVQHWEEIASSMEREVGVHWQKGGRARETYDLMRSIADEARSLDTGGLR